MVTPKSISRLAGEFLLIVAGVLVALAMESWADARGEGRLVNSYLGTLRAELSQDTALNRIFAVVETNRAESLRRLLDDLNGTGNRMTPAEELTALSYAAAGFTPLYVTSMMDELLQTGNARLLDEAVLTALQSVAQRLQISRTIYADVITELDDQLQGVVPAYMRRALRECDRSCSDELWGFDQTKRLEVADSLLEQAPDAELTVLQSWRSIANVRVLLEAEAYSALSLIEELESDRAALLRAIDALATSR